MSQKCLLKELTGGVLCCGLCSGNYVAPKMLDCSHSFCKTCLEKHSDDNDDSRRYRRLYNRKLTCPSCSKLTEIPTEGVADLPDDFILSRLTELVVKAGTVSLQCQICNARKSRRAIGECLNCRKYVCARCVSRHRQHKATESHDIVDICTQTQINCADHADESVRFYCDTCQRCICVGCTMGEHQQHQLMTFGEAYAKYEAELSTLVDKCEARGKVLSNALEYLKKRDLEAAQMEAQILETTAEFINAIREQQKTLQLSVTVVLGKTYKNLLTRRDNLEQLKENIKRFGSFRELLQKCKTVEVMLLRKELISILKPLLEEDLPSDSDLDDHSYVFRRGNVSLGDIQPTKTIRVESPILSANISDVFADASNVWTERSKRCNTTTCETSSQTYDFVPEHSAENNHSSSADLVGEEAVEVTYFVEEKPECEDIATQAATINANCDTQTQIPVTTTISTSTQCSMDHLPIEQEPMEQVHAICADCSRQLRVTSPGFKPNIFSDDANMSSFSMSSSPYDGYVASIFEVCNRHSSSTQSLPRLATSSLVNVNVVTRDAETQSIHISKNFRNIECGTPLVFFADKALQATHCTSVVSRQNQTPIMKTYDAPCQTSSVVCNGYSRPPTSNTTMELDVAFSDDLHGRDQSVDDREYVQSVQPSDSYNTSGKMEGMTASPKRHILRRRPQCNIPRQTHPMNQARHVSSTCWNPGTTQPSVTESATLPQIVSVSNPNINRQHRTPSPIVDGTASPGDQKVNPKGSEKATSKFAAFSKSLFNLANKL